ncbi:hypothetical protein EDD36DRAFT_231214 [Exophiala viscosa]|uniref:Zn(2)-C6 fungal-type domain-containing protein n=1 Tax=Exophiala viscosa TaxID=2486360 RepID=A0AAN6DXN3_9EURO|nr:hypothetical protein EDD36DRAFT_231214 [Exophiala viscosa]
MARPKVRPENRQRAAKACLPCKASKKRCDAQQPCSNCVRRKTISTCHYADESLVRSGRTSTQPANQTDLVRDSRYDTPTTDKRSRSPATTTNPMRPTNGRLLLNSKGEKVYVGGAASLTFLQFLRQTIKQQMGPSVFTEINSRNVMLEVGSPEDTSDNLEPEESQKRALIEVYFAATNGFLDLFSREELEEYLTKATLPTTSGREYEQAALDLTLALGGQCRASGPSDLRYASKCFLRAQKAALAGYLEDPCLDMVRCFLLMAFYMLGACRRNAAFMYLGIASQASSALGLHVTEQYRHFKQHDQGIRLRTLKSLRVLDVLVCTILGRNYSTPAIPIDTASFTSMHIHVGKPRDMALNASFGACSLIAEIMQSLDSDRSMEVDEAQGFLKRLQHWSSSLPNEIRHFSKATEEPLTLPEQEQIIGSIHVSCVYYFAVMLVTRPFLTSHLMSRLPSAMSQTSESMPTVPAKPEVTGLAQACIDSAILMSQTCHDALQTGILLNNMCIMKAWLFAAGLVLGFSMFAQGESPFHMDESFNSAREVLKKLADHSPQAEEYSGILIAFADAIQRHRQHLSREKRPNKYVSRILSLDFNSGESGSQTDFSPPTASSNLADQHTDMPDARVGDLSSSHLPTASALPLLEEDGTFDVGLFGWDSFAMQITENFSYENYDSTWGLAE